MLPRVSMPNKKEAISYIKGLPTASFKNEYGEKFNIHSNGIMVFMSGDEVDMMVDDKHKIGGYIDLFNPRFDIWSADELLKLGEALAKVAIKLKERDNERHRQN